MRDNTKKELCMDTFQAATRRYKLDDLNDSYMQKKRDGRTIHFYRYIWFGAQVRYYTCELPLKEVIEPLIA